MKRGEQNFGRVHAENAVRNCNQSMDLLKLGACLQGAVDVLQAAIVRYQVRQIIMTDTCPIINQYVTSYYSTQYI